MPLTIETVALQGARNLLVVDLFRHPDVEGRLTIARFGRPLHAGELAAQDALRHKVQLFSTRIGADIAARSLAAMKCGDMIGIETGATPEGHGLVLIVLRQAAPAEEPELLDLRSGICCAACGEAILSIHVERAEADRVRRARIMKGPIISECRGRIMGDIIGEASRSDGIALRSLQRVMVEQAEADIPLDTISIEEVKNRIEEIMALIDTEIVLPSDRLIGNAIRRRISKEVSRRSAIIEDVAWSMIRNNNVEFL